MFKIKQLNAMEVKLLVIDYFGSRPTIFVSSSDDDVFEAMAKEAIMDYFNDNGYKNITNNEYTAETYADEIIHKILHEGWGNNEVTDPYDDSCIFSVQNHKVYGVS